MYEFFLTRNAATVVCFCRKIVRITTQLFRSGVTVKSPTVHFHLLSIFRKRATELDTNIRKHHCVQN